MKSVTLNNGVEMPILGFGVYQIPPEDTQQAVEAALAAGYRHLDTAQGYGNEEGVGAAVAASGIPREELFVTTKLWIQHNPSGRVEDDTKRAFETSLRNLGLDRVDLFLIHQPFGDYYAEWRALRELHDQGSARAIGVSNFHADRLVDLIDHTEVTPAVNQIEVNPFHQRRVDETWMRDRGVQIESWGPFAEGLNGIFSNAVLSAIGRDHGKSVAQVVLRWLVERDIVAVSKSVRPERMAENLDVFDFVLTSEEMGKIANLETGESQFFDHRDPERAAWFGSRSIG